MFTTSKQFIQPPNPGKQLHPEMCVCVCVCVCVLTHTCVYACVELSQILNTVSEKFTRRINIELQLFMLRYLCGWQSVCVFAVCKNALAQIIKIVTICGWLIRELIHEN